MAKPSFVLLIDDNDADNEYHELMIARSSVPCQTRSFLDSQMALDYMRSCSNLEDGAKMPDIIFMDINMPVLNGFEFLDQLRTLPAISEIKKRLKIFMLTGSNNPEDRATAKNRYADLVDGFYIKPLTKVSFAKIVEENF